MRKIHHTLVTILSVIAVNAPYARDVVVCGTVTDTLIINKADMSFERKAVPAVCCTVSIRYGCVQTENEQYFARTNDKGYYSLIINMADNCTDKINVSFNGHLSDRVIRDVSVSALKGSIPDTLRQNLEVKVADNLFIDETKPDSIPQEIINDWKDQDGVGGSVDSNTISLIVKKLPTEYADKFNEEKKNISSNEKQYLLACHYRRVVKLKPYAADLSAVMFARHHNLGGFEVGYHDNIDATMTDDSWTAKGALCILDWQNYYPTSKDIITKTDAVVRDPCVSYDGKMVLFAMSESNKGSGYKIYEMEISNPTNIKELTKDPGVGQVVADFEPCYLPNGDIAFTSTRNFGLNSEGISTTTNMFVMNNEGKYIRQVGFDQMNTFYPVLMSDGTILYTRWEFNDRTLVSSMGLFTMNPDGSHQTEWFGNQNAWPLTIIHARPIQNSDKVIAIAGGIHGPYAGELMIIDRLKGTNGIQSINMIAPVRESKPDADKSDIAAGGVNFIFQTPYGLDENSFLISWRKSESVAKYNLYLMDITGKRELLAWADQSVSQPVLVKARKLPPIIATQADYSKDSAEFTMQDVYFGEGMKGIARGTAKKLRVVQLHYRVQDGTIGTVMPSGPSGSFVPAIFCPIALGACSWDAKEVLGETKIYDDGSASFKVPARKPVYFQVIDSLGYCIATMRSWSTLMPGEKFPCLGCHENKLESPPGTGQISNAGNPKPLEKSLGIEETPFDYPRMVQPILDKHCVSCHTANHESGFDLSGALTGKVGTRKAPVSYGSLLKGIGSKSSNNAVNINTIFSTPEQKAPYSFGACKSNIMIEVLNGTTHKERIKTDVTDNEKRIIACWIDLCAPLCGYENYFSNSDSIKYMKEVAIKNKWMDMETEGLKDLAKSSVIPDNNGTIKSGLTFVKQVTIMYLPTQRTIILNNNRSYGNFMLIDLRGKVISRMKISNQHPGSTLSISLPVSLSTGVYVAIFENAHGIQQMKFSNTK
jgi:hypothetical protein